MSVGSNLGSSWSTRRLSEFLAAVPAFITEEDLLCTALKEAAGAVRADAGAILVAHQARESFGFDGQVPTAALNDIAERDRPYATIDPVGACSTLTTRFDRESACIVLVRRGKEDFSPEETVLLEGFARILDLGLRSLRALAKEHQFERLARIQRSISHRAPLQEVLDAITAGAGELMGDEVVGLRLLDPADHDWMILRSVSGLAPEVSIHLERAPVGAGAGGLAIEEERLVIIDDYQTDPKRFQALADQGLQAAMAAPVYEYGELAGSLVVASYKTGRVYRETEQEILLAFAEHASLALTDARTVEKLREAQRSKDLFFAMASHELKTPLTVIMGTLHTIKRHHEALASDIREEMLTSAYERGKDLKDLIDRLLQGARAELAGLTRRVYLPELVERSVRGFDEARLHLGHIPETTVEIDDLAVYQVMGIFLENAFKHSAEGSPIFVDARLSDKTAELQVTNEGSLPKELDASELFEPFQRGSDPDNRGIGLGLYIAARLADALHGSVEVTSGEGRVVFSLRFPIGTVAERSLEVQAS